MKLLHLLIFLPVVVSAQNIDYNKVILPDKVIPAEFEEKLVQLAWKNHPANKVVMQNVAIAEKEKKQAAWSWLDDIYANGNLNEFTINPNPETSANLFFPKYNFGVRVSLGTLVRVPIETRIANDKLINTQHLVNEKKISVREDVLSNLERFKQYFAFRKYRQQLKDDFYTIFLLEQQKYEKGEIEFERYRSVSHAYLTQAEDVRDAETNMNASRISIESLIGIRLKDVEGYDKFMSDLDASVTLE